MTSPQPTPSPAQNRPALDDLPALDMPCVDCAGTGLARDPRDATPYGWAECDCTGYVLTRAGHAVLNLLRRHRNRA